MFKAPSFLENKQYKMNSNSLDHRLASLGHSHKNNVFSKTFGGLGNWTPTFVFQTDKEL